MLTKKEIIQYLKENKEFFKIKFDILKIGIFGSYARDEQTETSDIDIIIEMPLDTTEIFEKKQELKKVLKQTFHRNIDVCRERSIRPMFKKIILKDVIYA